MAEKGNALQEAEESLVVPNLLNRSQHWRIPNLPAQNKVTVVDANGHIALQAGIMQITNLLITQQQACIFTKSLLRKRTDNQKRILANSLS